MSEASDFQFPKPDEHTLVVGQNGSGKTQFGSWLLSESDFDSRPHIVLDFKRDELLNSIRHSHKITTKDMPPKKPGIFIAHSSLNDPFLEKFLAQIWRNNRTHLFVDETYMVDPRSSAFNAILTQGRSKRISITALTQRPVMCSRWLISEVKKIALFRLNDVRDQKTVSAFMPSDKIDFDAPLKEFHSHWYDVPRHFYTPLMPAPDSASILERIENRLRPRTRYL